MKKRIALLGIYHETNTFSKQLTTLAEFRSGFWLEEGAITKEYRGAHHEISGIIDVIESSDEYELVPVFYAYATPSGMVTADALEGILSRLWELYDKNGPYDGIFVVPHGAGVAENHPDMDGYWLQQLRARAGNEIPIVGTLDPHANVSQLMTDSTDGLFPYQTNPHIDQARVGREAARMMIAILSEGRKFTQTLLQLPLAISIEQQYTSESPCLDLLQFAESVRERHGLYSVSLLLGFPYADVAELGSAFILISEQFPVAVQTHGRASSSQRIVQTQGPASLPQRIAETQTHARASLRQYAFRNMHHFNGKKLHIRDWIPLFTEMEKPVLLLDMGDNVGGGSSAQSTHLLEELDLAGLSRTFICIYDPVAVSILENSSGVPAELTIGESGYVIIPESYRLIEGKFKELTPKHGGFVNYDMGASAIVKTVNGQTIMLTSLRTVPFSLQQLLAYDLQPEDFDFIVAKGVNAPIAAYKDVCKHLCKVDTPGDTSADMTRFVFNNRRIPLFPFEEPAEKDFS